MMTVPQACPDCLRRAQLLAHLAPYIERAVSGEPGRRAPELLRLDNERLAAAVAPRVASEILARVAAVPEERLCDELAAAECWACCKHDPAFPTGLREAPGAPWALIGRGDPVLLGRLVPENAVTIVGARRATTYGREVARQLGHDLAGAGLVVVSGLAFGIDACAHRGALDCGPTVAVLGCGPDMAHPAAHRSLWRRVGEQGLVLSELPPGCSAWRWSFPARNRIMAALSAITVVVEAGERSGSLITADLAAELKRSLGAVPGPVGARVSVGTNNLIARGARLIRGAEDVLDVMGRSQARQVTSAGSVLSRVQRSVLDALNDGAQSSEEVASDAGISGEETTTVLADLEALGYVEHSSAPVYYPSGLQPPSDD